MKAITSVYYGADTFVSIGTLSKEFTNSTICIDENTWNNGLGNFKMVNGGTDGVSVLQNFVFHLHLRNFSGLYHRCED